MITADCGFIQILGPDFGFWLLGSSNNPLFRMTNPETEDPEVIPITGPPTQLQLIIFTSDKKIENWY